MEHETTGSNHEISYKCDQEYRVMAVSNAIDDALESTVHEQ